MPAGETERTVENVVPTTTLTAATPSTPSATSQTPTREPVSCPEAGGDEASGVTQIKVWAGPSEDLLLIMQEIITAYDTANDDVEITVEYHSRPFEDFANAAPADRPDIALFPEFVARALADSGEFVPIGECLATSAVDLSDLLPVARATYTVDDQLWAMPYWVTIPVMYYDKRDFRAAGLDPEDPPATLAELRSALEQIVDAGAASVGMAIDTGTNGGSAWYTEQWLARLGHLGVDQSNGHEGLAEHSMWAQDDLIAQLVELRAMVDDGLVVSVGRNPSASDTLARLIAPEPAAVAAHTTGGLPVVLPLIDQGVFPEFELGLAPLPGPGQGALLGGMSWWLPDGPEAAKVRAALALAEHLTTGDAYAEWVARSSTIPVFRQVVSHPLVVAEWELHPVKVVPWEIVSRLPASAEFAGPAIGPRIAVREALAEAVEAVLAGGAPRAALEQAILITDDLLEAYANQVDGG